MSSTKWLGGSGSWTTASAWSSGIPATTAEALFQTGSSTPYTVSGGGTPGSLVVVGDQVDLAGTVSTPGAPNASTPYGRGLDATVSGGGLLTITGTFADGAAIVGNSTAGAVSVSGAGATWNTGIVSIGAGVAGGTLSVSNGALVSDYGGGLDNGTVSISGAGSTWENSLYLFDYPTTNLFVTNGGTLIGGGFFTSQGTLSLDDTAVLTAAVLSAQPGTVIQAINPSGQTSSAPTVLGLNLQPQASSIGSAQAGLFASAAGTALVLTGTIVAGPSSDVLATGQGTVFLTGTSGMTRSGTDIEGGTLVLGGPGAAGGAPVTFANGGVLVIGTAGPAGVVTVDGGAASETVFAGAGALLNDGSGQLTLINGNGASTVPGNSGSGVDTVFGGVGGGVFGAGSGLGHNILVAGAGAATLQGAATGDQLYANGTANDLLIAGTGTETLSGSGAMGNNLYLGGTGSDLIVAGGGSDTVTAGTGAQTIFGGTGSTTIQQSGGSATIVGGSGPDVVMAGSGYATVFGGTGADVYDFIPGQAGGTEFIWNFRPGTDLVHLTGYAQGGATTVVSGGSTIVTLPDQSRLIFVGISILPSSAFG